MYIYMLNPIRNSRCCRFCRRCESLKVDLHFCSFFNREVELYQVCSIFTPEE